MSLSLWSTIQQGLTHVFSLCKPVAMISSNAGMPTIIWLSTTKRKKIAPKLIATTTTASRRPVMVPPESKRQKKIIFFRCCCCRCCRYFVSFGGRKHVFAPIYLGQRLSVGLSVVTQPYVIWQGRPACRFVWTFGWMLKIVCEISIFLPLLSPKVLNFWSVWLRHICIGVQVLKGTCLQSRGVCDMSAMRRFLAGSFIVSKRREPG